MAMPGWENLIVCQGTREDPCTFGHLIKLVEVLIQDLVVLSTFIAVAVFCYAGFILLTSAGNTSALERAKGMFWKVLMGYLWILAAWLIVYTITSVLLHDGYSLLGSPKSN